MLNLEESKKRHFTLFKPSKKCDQTKNFFNLFNLNMFFSEYPKTRRVPTELLQNITIVPKIIMISGFGIHAMATCCLLYTSPSPRDRS